MKLPSGAWLFTRITAAWLSSRSVRIFLKMLMKTITSRIRQHLEKVQETRRATAVFNTVNQNVDKVSMSPGESVPPDELQNPYDRSDWPVTANVTAEVDMVLRSTQSPGSCQNSHCIIQEKIVLTVSTT